MVGWSIPANQISGLRSPAEADSRLQPSTTAEVGVERRSKRLRRFLASLRRYRPALAIGLDMIAYPAAEDQPAYVLVVTDGSLDWATVDRLSDGGVQAMLYRYDELLQEIASPDSLVRQALAEGPLLLGAPEMRTRLLQATEATIAELVR